MAKNKRIYLRNVKQNAVAFVTGVDPGPAVRVLEQGGYEQCTHVQWLELRWDIGHNIEVEGDEHVQKNRKSAS